MVLFLPICHVPVFLATLASHLDIVLIHPLQTIKSSPSTLVLLIMAIQLLDRAEAGAVTVGYQVNLFDLQALPVSSLTTLHLGPGFPTWDSSYCERRMFPWLWSLLSLGVYSAFLVKKNYIREKFLSRLFDCCCYYFCCKFS